MADITISDADIQSADAFLTQYLTDKVTDADFSEGSAVRDFVVKSMAYIYAFLESQRATAKTEGSLLLLAQQPPSSDVDSAVDAYLSNLFLNRKLGQVTRLPGLLHFSDSVDVTLSPSTRFFRTSSLLFVLDVPDLTVIPAGSLQVNYNADGTVLDYTLPVNLIATSVGTGYNIPPGRFLQVDRFNPYFLYAENVSTGVDGKDVESTDALIQRAPTALSTRNLINDRSITSVLSDQFPSVMRTLSVGMGEAEMLRDLTTESLSRLQLHTGGFTDIYVGLPRTTTTATGLVVGGVFPRADGRATILRDPTVGSNAFAGVRQGHVVNITQGLPAVPRKAVVVRATPSEIEVNARTPFPIATDEAGTPVSYSVGSLSPNFYDIVGTRATGVTSRSIVAPGVVVLPGGPVYKVKSVKVLATSTLIPTRVNRRPANASEYQVVVVNPIEAQSARAVTKIYVHSSLQGTQLEVVYDTLVGYDSIQTFVTGRFDRVINANHLVRGYHPVYVSVAIPYQRRSGAQNNYDQLELIAHVTQYINDFDWTDPLDFSSISQDLRTSYPDIGIVFPFQLNYSLFAPDGQVYQFTSSDIVTVFPAATNLATLTNGDSTNLAAQLTSLGVSDRTVRYLADTADVYVWER